MEKAIFPAVGCCAALFAVRHYVSRAFERFLLYDMITSSKIGIIDLLKTQQ